MIFLLSNLINSQLIFEEEEEEEGEHMTLLQSIYTKQQERLIPVINQYVISHLESFTMTKDQVLPLSPFLQVVFNHPKAYPNE